MQTRIDEHKSLDESRLRVRLGVVLVGMALAVLAGCGFSRSSTAIQAPAALHGIIHGGQKPVSGANVQLYSAGTAGRGSAAIPLLDKPVDSDDEGNFVIPASYYCPSASSQLYLVARGGNPGLPSGGDNPAIALTTMLGACGSLSASSSISVNEVTTVGSVWPVAQYMKSPTDLGSSAGDTAFLSAASSVNQFIDIAQGSSPGISTPESYFAENAKLYSLANALDKCVNSPGGSAGDGSPCGALFSMATPQGGTAPTDTMSAAMRIAQSPYNEVSSIYGLTEAPAAFQPTLTAVPPDWTLALSQPVATPAISLATGNYVGSQTVTISDTASGAKIYYTTDGTTPSSASLVYSAPLSIDVTSTVQAIAVVGISQSAVASSTLTITSGAVAGAPAKLAFLQQPSNTLVGAAISPAVRVVVQDVNGNTVSSATNLVRVNLTGVYGLGGTLEIAARNGVATFDNLAVGTAGSYTLTASSPSLASAASTQFTVNAASVNGIAAKLAFLQQPSNTLAGAIMTPSLRVAVEDANGNVVTSAANPVTLALTSGTGLTGTLTVTAAGGVATFGNLTVNAAGSYTLAAASPSLASASSTQFTVTAPLPTNSTAAKLAFLQQPSNALVGAVISPAVRVVVEDANGNTVTSATNLISVNLTGVYGLGGTLQIAARNGVATFNNLTVNTAGSYTLTASSPSLTSASSTQFTVTAPPVTDTAAKLAFLQQPSNTVAGATMAPPVQVALEDANGNVVTSASNPVTLALTSGTGLTGTLTLTPLNGVATFSNLAVSTAGAGYTLSASSPGLTTANSAAFTITSAGNPVGVAAKLVFVQQPTSGTTQAAISPAVTVAVEDANGNIVASAANPVTVALANSATVLGGTSTVSAQSGVATFSNLTDPSAGTGLTLLATSPGLASATSAAFTMNSSGSGPSGVSIVLTPGSVNLTDAQVQAFSGTVSGTVNTGITWSLSPAVGTIYPGGVYIAPASITSPQTVMVTATSVADPSKSANASITLAPPVGTSYYVSNSGSDSNNGTSPSSPWQTIAHVNAQSFQPGDSILFEAGGMWREQLNISWNGSLSSPITFGSYGNGPLPIISGSNILSTFTASAGAYYTPYTTAPNQVFRNGLRLYQVATQGALVTGAWWLDTANSRVWVYDNPSGATIEASQRTNAIYSPCLTAYITITGLQTEEAQGDGIVNCGSGVWMISGGVSNNNWGSGIHLQVSIAPSAIANYTTSYNGVDGAEFYDTPGLLVYGVTANYNVQKPAALYLAGIKWDPSSGSVAPVVEYSNTCYNGIAQPGYGMPSQSSYITGSGIWGDTIGNGWIVHNNTTCGNNQRGIDIDADNYAIVYDNISYSNLQQGIIAYADNQPSMTGHQIYNNTVWGNGTGIFMQGPNAGETPGGCKNNSVQNNISYASKSYNFFANTGCENPGTDGSGNVYTYNAFGTAGTYLVFWGNSSYPAYASWENSPGNCDTTGCTHSVESDPMLTNPSGGLFTLQSGSPAIGAGLSGADLGAIPYAAQ